MGNTCSCINRTQDNQTCNLCQKQCLTNENKTESTNIRKNCFNGFVKNIEEFQAYSILLLLSKNIKGFLFRKSKWYQLEENLLKYQSDLYNAFEKKNCDYIPSNMNLPNYSKDNWREFYKEIPFRLSKVGPLFKNRIIFCYNKKTNEKIRKSMSIDQLVTVALSAYKGSADLFNNKHGEGVLITNEGEIFKGTWNNNEFIGWNELIEPNGYIYIGNFVNGEIFGKGEKYSFVKENEYTYRGDFVNGLKEGQGIEISDNRTFVGEFKNDFKLKGKLTFDTGNTYEGEFNNDHFNGKGHYIWKSNGHQYIGNYKNDKFDGEGIYRWNENDYYKGGYKTGLKHGMGQLNMKNGTVVYNGPFEYGQMHGVGHYKCGNYNGPAEFINGQLNKNYTPKKKIILKSLNKKKKQC